MSMRGTRRTGTSAVLVGMLLALAGGGVASADQSVNESGETGVHRLREAPDGPPSGWGADCFYGQAAHRLSRVVVKSPVAFAFDDSPGAHNDLQWIGWRARIQRWDGAAWITHWTSDVVKKQANDDVSAPFNDDLATRKITYTVPQPGLTLRALVRIFWYDPPGMGIESGQSTRLVENYSHRLEGDEGLFTTDESPCQPILPG